METLYSLFPDAGALMELASEDLAPILLRLASARMQPAGFIPEVVVQVSAIDVNAGRDYPFHKKQAVESHLNKAWNWVEREALIEPAPGMNGRNGWRVFTETGEAVARGQDLAKLRAVTKFPKDLLHPLIREKSWRAILRNSSSSAGDDLTDAVRSAFATLEESVRTAGALTKSDFGVDLMRNAFNPDKGPLRDRDTTKPKPEREASAIYSQEPMLPSDMVWLTVRLRSGLQKHKTNFSWRRTCSNR